MLRKISGTWVVTGSKYLSNILRATTTKIFIKKHKRILSGCGSIENLLDQFFAVVIANPGLSGFWQLFRDIGK